VSPAPLGAGPSQARLALARELETLLSVSKTSQREIARRLNISQSMASRVVNGTASLTNEEIVRWAQATRADHGKTEHLRQLNEQAARIGTETIPAGSTVWSFTYTLVHARDGPTYLAVVIDQAELLVTNPDPALAVEHRRQLKRIAADAIANEPATDARIVRRTSEPPPLTQTAGTCPGAAPRLDRCRPVRAVSRVLRRHVRRRRRCHLDNERHAAA
jgi:transcriptional regulator with XRE-family HTH domain